MFICGFDGSGPVIQAIETGGPIRATGALDAVAIGKPASRRPPTPLKASRPPRSISLTCCATYQTKAVNQKLLAELNS